MKKVLLAVVATLLSIGAFAQEETKIRRWSQFDLLGSPSMIALNTSQGLAYQDFYFGLSYGFGYNSDREFVRMGVDSKDSVFGVYIPLYLTVRNDIAHIKSVTPYFEIKAGLQWFCAKGVALFALHPTFGIEYKNIQIGTSVQALSCRDFNGKPYERTYDLIFSVGYNF